MITFILKKIKNNPFLWAVVISILFIHLLHEISYLKKKKVYIQIV